MLLQTLAFLISTAADFFALTLLLRFMLQLVRVPPRNQLSEFAAALTNFMVRPARRVIPGLWGLDLASLTLAWLVELLQIWALLELKGYELGSAAGIALAAIAALAALQLARLAVYVVLFAIVLQAILSWVNPYTPLAPLLTTFTRPFLRPFQKMIPLIANIDLSPLFALVVCQLLLAVPLLWFETEIRRFL